MVERMRIQGTLHTRDVERYVGVGVGVGVGCGYACFLCHHNRSPAWGEGANNPPFAVDFFNVVVKD